MSEAPLMEVTRGYVELALKETRDAQQAKLLQSWLEAQGDAVVLQDGCERRDKRIAELEAGNAKNRKLWLATVQDMGAICEALGFEGEAEPPAVVECVRRMKRKLDEARALLRELEFSRYCRGADTGACHFCRAGTSDELNSYPKKHEPRCKMAAALGEEAGDAEL